MKLVLNNLGRIKNATIEIKPLTVFIGPNNTNKTWAAYACFSILESLRAQGQRLPNGMNLDDRIDDLTRTFCKDLRQRLSRLRARQLLKQSIARRTLLERADSRPWRFRMGVEGIRAAIGARLDSDCDAAIEYSPLEFAAGAFDELRLAASRQPESLVLEYMAPGERDPAQSVVESLASLEAVVRGFLLALHNEVRCLPSERNLLAQMFPVLASPGGPAQGLPRPLVDFVYMMALETRDPRPGHLKSLSLSAVVGGEYRIAEHGPILFAPRADSNINVPILGSASFVKSLVGLDVFIRRARRGDMVVIDEPEMNAHPAAIVALTEALAALANAGVNVLITTHSPYFVDHLTNLMEASTLPAAKQNALASKLWLNSPSACISPDNLAIYYFADRGDRVEVMDALNREQREIDWSTFSDVGERVTNLLGEILEMKGSDAAASEQR